MNMQYVVRRTVMIFLVVEIIFFMVIYGFGPKSIKVLYDMYETERNVQEEIALLSCEVMQLQQKIKESELLFTKERIAREQLLMKKEHETVWLLK